MCEHKFLRCSLVTRDNDYNRVDICSSCNRPFKCEHFITERSTFKYGRDHYRSAKRAITIDDDDPNVELDEF